MNAIPDRQDIRTGIKHRLRLALALLPGTSGLCVFIAIMSPHSFTANGFNYLIGLFAIGVGMLLAYSAAMFVDEALEKRAEKEK